MSSVTIDSILQDIRSSESGAEEITEKTASPNEVSFSENEIDSMAELLKKAEYVQEEHPNVEVDTEKIAEMSILLGAAFDTLADADKYETLRKEASKKGYEKEVVDEFIEKQASMNFLKNLNKKQILMGFGMGIAGGGAAGAAGGYQYGKKEQKEKTKEVAQGAFRAGRLFQHQRQQGRLEQLRQRIADRLKNMGQG